MPPSNQNKRLQPILETLAGLAILARSLLLRMPRPQHKGNFRLQRLKAPVEVLRDRWGVPHIYATSVDDLFFAQGFIHAQERLWQMDFNRRLVAGRLSEILGAAAVPLDRWMRILGMRRAAEKQAAIVDSASAMLESYVSGINAFIHQNQRLPMEFSLLRYEPDAWTSADPLSWAKMMAWDLSVNWETEILRAQLIARLGPEKAAELEPPHDRRQPFIIPEGVDYSCIGNEASRRASEARKFTGPAPQEGLGSNNWVLSGERTKSGLPLLANDMHLVMNIPSLWFENHLVAGELNVTGVTFPGIPGVTAGHNPHVAWGFTNGFTDVQDLYIEHLRRTNDSRVEYEYQGKWVEAEVIPEVIRIKGEAPVIEEVIITRHGPIINALAPGLCGEAPLALRWTALEPDNLLTSLVSMNLSRNCSEFRDSLRQWSVPSQNVVYADTQGNIGYSLPGKLPIRARGDGQVPVPGWSGEYEWLGYVPFEELPHMFNPPQGFVATANNKVIDERYPHWLGNDYISANRAKRIVEMIEAQPKLGVEDIRRMHTDQVCLPACRMVEVLKTMHSDSPELHAVLERMCKWDGCLSVDCPEASVYEVFIRRILFRLLTPRLGDLAEGYIGKGPTPVLKESSMFGEHARDWLFAILDDPASEWFNLGDGQSRDDHLLTALQESVDYLKKTCGKRMQDWKWGKLHQITFNHALGSVKPLDRFFNRGPFPLGGDGDTIWAAVATYMDLSHKSIVGPPFRLIADLSDWNNSQGMLVPGQSGHPASRHYANNIRGWLKGEYHPMLFDRQAVLGAVTERLDLLPI